MRKTLLLFLLLPFFGFTQVDLVKWNALISKYTPTLNANVSSADISAAGGPSVVHTDYSGDNIFYQTGTWPAPDYNGGTYDPSKYISLQITADAYHKVDLSSLSFECRSEGNTNKFRIKYSQDPNFVTDVKDLMTETVSTENWTPYNPTFLAGSNTILPTKTVYIRLYVYSTYNNFQLKIGSVATNGGPTIKGTTTLFNPSLKAVDDSGSSVKNNFTFINVTSNDLLATNSNPITSITVASQPTNSGGTAVVNAADKTIKFTPAVGFTGPTSFTYTIGDGTSTSTATVNVNVTEPIVTELVKWNGPGVATGTVAVPVAVEAGDITSKPTSLLSILPNEGFKTAGWPTNFAKDDDKYVQFTVTAKTGYKLNLNSFNFTYHGAGNVDVKRYQVRYSKDGFATSYLLLDEATTTGKLNKSLSLANLTLVAGQTLTIRIYGYKVYVLGDLNSPIFLENSNTIQAGNTTPTITGTILQYDATDINANDDNVLTRKNTPIKINSLNNDTAGSNAISDVIIANQPAAGQGSVVVNADKTLTYTPATDFTGDTFFKYTISNSTQSATGTVFVKVEEATPSLVIWNGASQQPIAAVSDPNITATNINATGMTFGSNYGNFRINSIPTTIDYSKYIQVSVTPKAGYKLDLTQFKFTYNSPTNQDAGPKKYQVRYSTDPTFPSNGNTLIAETNAVLNTQTTASMNFPPGVVATPTQTVYIRIYLYDSGQGYTDYYLINDNGGDLGPTITGIVSNIDTLTANYDNATTTRNQAVTIPVLANDIRGSLPLQPITISTQSTNGIASVSGENVIFTPANGFIGSTSFVYTISNGSATSSAIVFVTVTDPPCIAALTPGNNYWKGYVYTYTGDTPAATTYVGTVAEYTNFERNVEYSTITGDPAVEADNFCGPIPAENFLVKYIMKTTTTADTYNFTVGADDGVRVYVDNNLITLSPTGSWGDHGYTVYVAQVPLTAGEHTFLLEYYEKGGIARVSFSYGAVKGLDPSLPFGINEWNVYGFNLPDIDLQPASYAGHYVDSHLNIDTQTFWDKTKSPSNYTNWQGAPMPIDNFAITYKRRGFPCGRYQLNLANCDDVAKILINGVEIFTQNGYSPNNVPVNPGTLYFLNENSTVEVRLREDGGDANVALNFTDTPTVYNGTGTFLANTTSIKIETNTTLNNDVEVCSCTIDPNVILTIPADKTLTVNQNITIGAGGKLLLQNNASLLQTSVAANAYTGDFDSFVVERNTAPVRRYDFTFWSSPVNRTPGFTLYNLSPETFYDKYYSYVPATGWKISFNGVLSMEPGMGYIVRAPQSYDLTTAAVYPATFIGKPNNGDYFITPLPNKSILIGNPYPSALDAAKFIQINHDINADVGALYFWTHNSPPSTAVKGDAKYNYTTSDYAVYSLTGGVATSKGATSDGYKTGPTGKIASGQAFFIQPNSANQIRFTNEMRIGGNNTQFFKTTDSEDKNKNRLWLNLTNEEGAFKQTLIGYLDEATNGWDINYDGLTLAGNTYVDFYSINETNKLTIQGRALPFSDADLIPLGYKSSIVGDFTISIDHTDGLFDTQAVYLEDKTTGKTVDLRAANYTFATEKGTFEDRFVLSYTNKTLGTGDFENIENGLLVSVKDKVIKVTSAKENIKEVTIFDINGKQLQSKNKIASTELQISNLQAANQVLLVKVTLENDYVVTKKIVFQ